MSRAFRGRVKKRRVRTAEEVSLMRPFGAVGLESGLQGFGEHLVSDVGFGFQADALPPLPGLVPLDRSILAGAGESSAPAFVRSPEERAQPLLLPESFEASLSDAELLDGLVELLHDSGLRVREARQLGPGVRITVDELLAQAKVREPVLVRVGG
jgi:hypothetical protein